MSRVRPPCRVGLWTATEAQVLHRRVIVLPRHLSPEWIIPSDGFIRFWMDIVNDLTQLSHCKFDSSVVFLSAETVKLSGAI